MTHAEQLRIRMSQTDRRIAHQQARLKQLRELDAAGIDQATEGLLRLTDIREAYARILAGPCPLTYPPQPRRPDPRNA